MKVKRKIIQIDDELCDGCGQCVPSCAEGAIQIVDGKAKLLADKFCDGLGACLGECPTGALTIIEKETDAFDEQAVQEHLNTMAKEQQSQEAASLPRACPSAKLHTFAPSLSHRDPSQTAQQRTTGSALSHWPIQIRLVPPTAPFLKGADLLVAADCTPFAYPNFHEDFIAGKVLLVGCPKFDDVKAYVQRFADIFKTADIQSITIVVMEVPCCHGLPMIIEKGMKTAKKEIPLEKVTISARGDLLAREKIVA